MPKGPQPVDSKLLEKSLKPTMTIAMGLKLTHNASVCWRDQVNKEGKLKREWNDTYNPEWEKNERDVIERVKEREEAKRAEALARPERELLIDGVSKEGKGRVAYLAARNRLNPQEKLNQPATVNQTIGWGSVKSADALDDPWKRPKGVSGPFRRPVEMEGMY